MSLQGHSVTIRSQCHYKVTVSLQGLSGVGGVVCGGAMRGDTLQEYASFLTLYSVNYMYMYSRECFG